MHGSINKELKIECKNELDYSILDSWSQIFLYHPMPKGQFQVFLYWKRQLHEYVLSLLYFVTP